MTKSPSLFSINKTRSLVTGGRRLDYSIYRSTYSNSWRLEFTDDVGTSYLWEDPFVSEQAALSVARYVLEQ